MKKSDVIKIGEAAQLLGVSVVTMRQWERTEEVPPLRKSASGTRYYSREKIMAMCDKEEVAEGDRPEQGDLRVAN